MAERYMSINVILDKALRHPLLSTLNLEGAIDYTVDFMRIVGVPKMFHDKVTTIDITSYRGLLPTDWVETAQVRPSDTNTCIREATDTFYAKDIPEASIDTTFKIQGNIIYASFEEGTLEMAYKAIMVDDNGIPMVPDNSSFTRALTAYIKKEYFTILFDLGKIGQGPFSKAEQDYAWAVGDYESEGNRMSLSRAESFFNSLNTLIPRTNEFKRGFLDDGTKDAIH